MKLMDKILEEIDELNLCQLRNKLTYIKYFNKEDILPYIGLTDLQKRKIDELVKSYSPDEYTGKLSDYARDEIKKEKTLMKYTNKEFTDNKQYYLDYIAERQKQLRDKSKEATKLKYQLKHNEYIECECGMMSMRRHLERHKKSKRHQEWLAIQPV